MAGDLMVIGTCHFPKLAARAALPVSSCGGSSQLSQETPSPINIGGRTARRFTPPG